jgi:hypothetical protein
LNPAPCWPLGCRRVGLPSISFGFLFSVFAELLEVDRCPRGQDEVADPMNQTAGDQVAHGSLDAIALLELHRVDRQLTDQLVESQRLRVKIEDFS